MPKATDRAASKIAARDWNEIRDRWIGYVPNFAVPGIAPECLLSELPALDAELTGIPDNQIKILDSDLPGLRQGVLHEGVYLLHKAAHIFGASLVHVRTGMCTWSLSSAYHSAYFAIKSIFAMLGLVALDTDNKGAFLLDVWHPPEGPGKRKKGPSVYLYRSGKLEHVRLWECFQRVLSKTESITAICDSSFRSLVVGQEPEQFAKQRNSLHYRTTSWICSDLHACSEIDDFGKLPSGGILADSKDFSLLLAFGLLRMGMAMVADMAKSSKPLLAEQHLLDAWLSQPFNRLYRTNAGIPNASASSPAHFGEAI